MQETEILEIQTPITCCVVHRVQNAFNAKPTKQNLELIFKSMACLLAQSSIQQHKNLGLRQALKLKQKKHQRRKRLNLISGKDIGP